MTRIMPERDAFRWELVYKYPERGTGATRGYDVSWKSFSESELEIHECCG
jgi:hypothetical protein